MSNTTTSVNGSLFNDHLAHPLPPIGWVKMKKASLPCPRCKATMGMMWGGAFNNSYGFQAPWVERLYLEMEGVSQKEQEYWQNQDYDYRVKHSCPGCCDEYDPLCVRVDGDMIKCHWSRWGSGICTECYLRFWGYSDDLPKYKHHKYHEPISNLVKLDAQSRFWYRDEQPTLLTPYETPLFTYSTPCISITK